MSTRTIKEAQRFRADGNAMRNSTMESATNDQLILDLLDLQDEVARSLHLLRMLQIVLWDESAEDPAVNEVDLYRTQVDVAIACLRGAADKASELKPYPIEEGD